MAQVITPTQAYERSLDKEYPERQVCPICGVVHYSDDSNVCDNCLNKIQRQLFLRTPRR